MSSLWEMEFGEIGAVLKILDKHGVKKEELDCLRQDPEGIGRMLALEIERIVARSTLYQTYHIGLNGDDLMRLIDLCKFVDLSPAELDWLRKRSETVEIGMDVARNNITTVGVFKFHRFQFDGLDPIERPGRITELMNESGYMPAPFRLFILFVNYLLNLSAVPPNKKVIGLMKPHPLVSLDPFFEADGSYPAVANQVFCVNNPSLKLGNIDLLRDEKLDPSQFLYFGFVNN